MARSRKLEVVVAGDAKDLNRTFQKVDRDAGHLEKRMHRFGANVGSAFKLAGGAAVGALAVGLKQSVDAAIEAEKSQARLQAQLKASGINYREHAAAIDEAIQKTSRLAGLDDEDLQDAFTNIVRVTGDVNKSLKLTGLAADFARAKHIDVAKAGEIVGKVAGGNTGVLGRYGIKIKEGATATEALGKLQQKFSGQAEAYGKTTAGAQDRFRVAVENLQEKIGEKLLPVLTRVADKAATFVDQMSRGTGAGGRFADKLKEIADKVRPIAKFFADHPKLIAVAVGAWATYRVAAVAATAASRLKLIGMFAGLGPKAAAGGAVAGRSFGTAASTGAAGKLKGFGWAAVGAAIGFEIGKPLAEALGHWLAKAIGDLQNRDDIVGRVFRKIFGQAGPAVTLKDLGVDVPKGLPKGRQPIEGDPSAVTQPLTPRPVTGRPPRNAPPLTRRPPRRRPPVNAPPLTRKPPKARSAVARAAVVRGAQPSPDDIVAAVEATADRIDRSHVPYAWGGGHGRRFGSGDKVIPMDCSGAVSAALGIDPRVSGQFVTWGSPGDGGNRGITIYANATHVLMKINGRFWGTSRSNPGGGPGWIDGGVSAGYLSRFTARHMAGTTAGAVAGTVVRAQQPRLGPLTATLVGGAGGGSKAPGKMGGPVIGSPGDAFFPAPSAEQIAVLAGDPDTDPKARTARLFQLAVRRNKIMADLTSGKVKRPAKRQELLDELRGINSEISSLQEPGTGTAAIPGADAYLGVLDRDAALAELTPDTADDQDVARRTLQARRDILAYMQSHPGFSDTDIAQAARDVKTAQDAADTAGGVDGQALLNELAAIKDELRRENDRSDHILAVAGREAIRTLGDVIAGQIGATYGQRALTPAGGGAPVRY